ncbi:aminotransferase class I/II-fold pyridoxal phosphate-dependent enzyme, partial [Acinetobacter baumannii]
AATWLSKRFKLPRAVDPETEVLVLNGSREGLFFAAITAQRFVGPREGRPAILMPNPFYPAYGAGARAAGCDLVYLPTTPANGFLPDLDS